MATQGKPRRFALALLVALALAFVLVTVKTADAQVAYNPCRNLTSDDWSWWLMGCYLVP